MSSGAHRRPGPPPTTAPVPASTLARRDHPLPPHAVVIGAGFHGLAAAHALGHHLEWVTLVERDDLPDRTVSRASGPHGRYLAALRRVLDSPQVVVRAGLEAVGLTVVSGRACGVEVLPRQAAPGGPTVAILADLVVDSCGVQVDRTAPLPDGLLLVGPAAAVAGCPGTGAERAAAVLGRCVAEHVRRHPDLTGFSAIAQLALSQRGTDAPRVER